MHNKNIGFIRTAIRTVCAALSTGLFLTAAQAQVAVADAQALAAARAASGARVATAAAALRQAGTRVGLTAASDFLATSSEVDRFAFTHTRFQQRLRGIPVWGGEIVTHTAPDGQLRQTTNQVRSLPDIETAPRVSRAMALAVVDRDLMRKGAYSQPPQVELVIYPVTAPAPADNAVARPDPAAAGKRLHHYRLAYHLLVATRNAQDGLREMRYFVDAQSGAILDKWSELQHAHALATGARSIFNGILALNTNSTGSGFELRDLQRGTGGHYGNNVVLRYMGPGTSAIFTDATNTWGDGRSYQPGSASHGSDDTAQSAAVDVAYATAVTWDMYRNVFGRLGFDGTGKSVHSTVHMYYYGFPYNTGANATWSGSCECMDFGYGDAALGLKNVVDIDIVGHELTHGLVQKTAGLVYKAESGGLNEGYADIFGLAVKFYARSGGHARAATVVEPSGAWQFAENLGNPAFTRYFVRPSTEMGSFDAWDGSFIDNSLAHDVHRISGPIRRAFYFMSNGAAPSGDGYTPLLPAGSRGIGMQASLAIWYRALSFYMTRLTDFAGARQALLSAARDLHGPGSAQERAVWDAFGGINVGPTWRDVSCGRLDSSRQLSARDFVSSCNGQYMLVMQPDGNLVLYSNPGVPVWHAGTYGNAGAYATLQADGNLVVYKADGLQPLWNSGSYGAPGATIAVRDDGNLVASAPNGVPVWSLRQRAEAADVWVSAQTNTTLASAEAIAAAISGITGSASWHIVKGHEQPAYFKFILPAGKTIRWDFVGGVLVSSRWELEALDSAGTVLTSTSDTGYRQILSHTNRSGAPAAVILRVGRRNFETTPDMISQKFSVAVGYH